MPWSERVLSTQVFSMPFGACGRVKLDFRFNSRNEISVFNVELIVARVCRCSSTATLQFSPQVCQAMRKTVSNIYFTISHVAVLVMAVLDVIPNKLCYLNETNKKLSLYHLFGPCYTVIMNVLCLD